MTQSGQGEEPSARPAREGIVLPSDGGEPLLPGMAGGPADRSAGPQHVPSGSAPASAPAGGQAWGQAWGPDQQQAPQPEQGWQAPPAQPWGAPEQAPQAPQASWGTPDASSAPQQPGPLPAEGAPAYGGEAPGSYGGYAAPGTGPDGYAQPAPDAYAGGTGGPVHGAPAHGAMPLPPAVPADEGATQFIPPVTAGTPAPGNEGATQYIPPVTAHTPAPGSEGATQYLPPVPAGADEGATQFLPPVGPGALPPEAPAGRPPSSESTQYLGRARANGPGAQPAAGGSDADATQYIPPVPGAHGDRQPPSEFDNLFRSGPGGDGPAAATQHMPRYQEPRPAGHAPQPSYDTPGPARGRRAARDGDGGGRGGRGGSRVPLIAVCGIAIAVVGVGAGALLAGGEGDEKNAGPKTVSATAPSTEEETSAAPSADPAEQQAIALDKLLADSGDSRTSVINAVDQVRKCGNLAKAAKDLRDAAGQRNALVTQLSGLSVDKLPDHAALTGALDKAWKASAAADNHYAAWADQVAGQRKLCKKGQARSTAHTAAGHRESDTASKQKTEAAKLWNAIARKYGLTERQPIQL
ncbi:hypothetical protein [Streptomyces cadmiisoli]|uniref:hypothetical protein n=1 Tax=Streptomyces cadmiisoli TaxID=2184053 RepID=UPI003D75D480